MTKTYDATRFAAPQRHLPKSKSVRITVPNYCSICSFSCELRRDMPTYIRIFPNSPSSLIRAFSTSCKKTNMAGVEQPRPSLGPNRSSTSSVYFAA